MLKLGKKCTTLEGMDDSEEDGVQSAGFLHLYIFLHGFKIPQKSSFRKKTYPEDNETYYGEERECNISYYSKTNAILRLILDPLT